MFELVDRPVLWIPVRWPTLKPGPTPDDLAIESETEIELLVEIIDRDEFKAKFLDPEDKTDEADLFERLVRNWRKVANKGVAAPYNRENAALLLKAPGFAGAFTTAYMNAVAGKLDLREKNSESSLSNGRAGEPLPQTTPAMESLNGSAAPSA